MCMFSILAVYSHYNQPNHLNTIDHFTTIGSFIDIRIPNENKCIFSFTCINIIKHLFEGVKLINVLVNSYTNHIKMFLYLKDAYY